MLFTSRIMHHDQGKSWTAEFYIPYALLKPIISGPPVKGSRWRANFYRIDYDHGQRSNGTGCRYPVHSMITSGLGHWNSGSGLRKLFSR